MHSKTCIDAPSTDCVFYTTTCKLFARNGVTFNFGFSNSGDDKNIAVMIVFFWYIYYNKVSKLRPAIQTTNSTFRKLHYSTGIPLDNIGFFTVYT